jgi:hypothetical protein
MNTRKLRSSIAVFLGVVLIIIGQTWGNYTFRHSSNPAIDTNIGAALVVTLGGILLIVALVYLIITYRRHP